MHPNLRKRTKLRFTGKEQLESADIIFSALPHGNLMNEIEGISELAARIIDLSGDFRLKDPGDYEKWYGLEHPRQDLLGEFVYGMVELHREEIRKARYVSSPGCNATATILPLHPLVKHGIIDLRRGIVAEAKCGSSEGGNAHSPASHHPERSGCVRSYKPVGHRHIAEMRQELSADVDFSATSIEMVRGILTTAHLRTADEMTERDIRGIYHGEYGNEPFIRIVKERSGIYRYPEPKLLSGTNYCDIGFALEGRRLVVMGAVDNLVKGAAGQAVHAMNVMCGFEETAGLEFGGLHPI
jgi:N-acetyl-gamma-glutamyl-phosphate/LysW-gamma-L-alpha-aminoadipyl-6-phosphate reductase